MAIFVLIVHYRFLWYIKKHYGLYLIKIYILDGIYSLLYRTAFPANAHRSIEEID
jgi:hypothetical protein